MLVSSTIIGLNGIIGKIKTIVKELKIWNQTSFGHVGHKIKILWEKIAEVLQH